MAEDQDRSREDLTEEASPHRIEEFRRKGQVVQSRELSGLAVLLATGVTAYLYGPTMTANLTGFMREVFSIDLSARSDLGSLPQVSMVLAKAVHVLAAVGLPICIVGFVAGVASCYAQVGSIFSTDPLSFDLKKINPLSGLQRLFSMKQGLDAIRLVFKMIVVVWVSYALVKTQVLESPGHISGDVSMTLASYAQAGKGIFLALIAALGVFAGFDYWLQRWEFSKNVRLTKQEAKQEHREREGDPQIKARIRAVQREAARKRMMQAVKKADVIITNPTHIAIAISYDKNSMAAPRVVAKGADLIAQKIKQIAADAGVPLVENVPLARTLYKTVKINQFVPRALYQAVAEVLAYVYRLKGKVKS
jgi:flagellar biosynthetic protein FlhB